MGLFTKIFYKRIFIRIVQKLPDLPLAAWMVSVCVCATCTQVRLHIGLYAVYLSDWLAVYPRSSFLIVRTETYLQDRAPVLSAIVSFLGLGQPDTNLLLGYS